MARLNTKNRGNRIMKDLGFGTRRLVSQEDASMIEGAHVPRSRFAGSWTHLKTLDAGFLVPFLVDEVLPGDHLSYNVTAYVRMATPLFPLFSNQRIDTFFFFVPNRLVWDNWVKLMGEVGNPEAESPDDYAVPVVNSDAGGFQPDSIFDHMGIPCEGQTSPPVIISVNAMPLRAYNLIYDEWFRDQNIIQPVSSAHGDGPDTVALFGLQRRAKSHDYFTSALPWPQKFTSPGIALGGLAPVQGLAIDIARVATAGDPGGRETSGDDTTDWLGYYDASAAANLYVESPTAAGQGTPAIFADLAAATGTTINALRQSFLIQQLLERDARGGTRYTEIVFSHFGVRSPDMRLQRPEYIGGGQTPLITTPIAQTAPSATEPVGTLGGATTAAGTHRASYASTEHGFIIGLINVRSELLYQQGLHKMWSRSNRYDYYWPSLAGLGEQAILRKEIYLDGDPELDGIVFGYQERWHEYRTRTSEVVGVFRSNYNGANGPIDQWHLAQDFGTPPVLDQGFIEDTPPMERILAAAELAENQQYLADICIRRTATRPLPMFGTPALLGRF